MFILVENETNLVKYANHSYIQYETHTEAYSSEVLSFIIGDLNSNNSTIFEVEGLPGNFIGNKYTYEDGIFAYVE